MRIVFFGSPHSAIPSLEELQSCGHRIELIITQPDRPAGRGKELSPSPVKRYALDHGIPILQPEKIRQDTKTLEALKNIQPDINVVVAYGQIIPPSLIYFPRYNSVNVHFSLLPKYRGASPVQWAILSGEEKTGVTIFELNEKMDEGDILTQEEVEIGSRETARELEDRLARVGARILIRTLADIDRIKKYPQDHSQASFAPRLKKEQGKIDWNQDACSIDRMVRAFTPWPGAFTFFKGQRILVHAGKVSAESERCPSPGQILAVTKQGIEVCCKWRSIYSLERLQRENRKVMEASAFSQGIKIKDGDSFG